MGDERGAALFRGITFITILCIIISQTQDWDVSNLFCFNILLLITIRENNLL